MNPLLKEARKAATLIGGSFDPNKGFVPITSDTLEPTQPIKLPPTATPTESTGLLGQFEVQADQFTENLKQQTAQREGSTKDALSDLVDTFRSTEGETSLGLKAEKEVGLAQKEGDLQDINNQMLREQEGLRRQIEAIQTNPGTATMAERNREVQEVQRVSLRKQADLSIIQLAAQGKYDSAKAIADRAVKAQLEQQRMRLDQAQFIYDENKDLFTKSEQRLFESQQADRTRALNREEANLKQISDLALNALQNGAPPNIATRMQQAKTVQDAINLGGQYIDRIDRIYKQAQIDNVYSEISARRNKAVEEVLKISETNSQAIEKSVGIQELINTLSTHGGLSAATGKSSVIANRIPGSKAYDAAKTFEQLRSALSLDGLKAMKGLGAMSDREFNTVANAATKLDLGLSEKEFRTELNKIADTIDDVLLRGVNTGELDIVEYSALKGISKDDLEVIGQSEPMTNQSTFNPSSYY